MRTHITCRQQSQENDKMLLSFQINELAGACHICGSRHYAGLAVDLVDGPRNVEFKLTCNIMGGLAIEEPGQIHCQFNK